MEMIIPRLLVSHSENLSNAKWFELLSRQKAIVAVNFCQLHISQNWICEFVYSVDLFCVSLIQLLLFTFLITALRPETRSLRVWRWKCDTMTQDTKSHISIQNAKCKMNCVLCSSVRWRRKVFCREFKWQWNKYAILGVLLCLLSRRVDLTCVV
jgi:hypothetical protein